MKKIQDAKLKIRKDKDVGKRVFCSRMPIVESDCGAKILVVPDLAAMSKAIKIHLSGHKGADEQFLIEQVFNAISGPVLLNKD
jgi:hypothetical protein